MVFIMRGGGYFQLQWFPAGPDAPDVPPMLDYQVYEANPDHLQTTNVLHVTETAADLFFTSGPSFGYSGSFKVILINQLFEPAEPLDSVFPKN